MVLFCHMIKLTPQNTRTLKIERAGDSFAGKTYPKIRLQGHWLADLGFKPTEKVTVVPVGTGELLLRSCQVKGQSQEKRIISVDRKTT